MCEGVECGCCGKVCWFALRGGLGCSGLSGKDWARMVEESADVCKTIHISSDGQFITKKMTYSSSSSCKQVTSTEYLHHHQPQKPFSYERDKLELRAINDVPHGDEGSAKAI